MEREARIADIKLKLNALNIPRLAAAINHECNVKSTQLQGPSNQNFPAEAPDEDSEADSIGGIHCCVIINGEVHAFVNAGIRMARDDVAPDGTIVARTRSCTVSERTTALLYLIF